MSIKALCYNHRDESKAPRLCATCQRIIVEHKIVTKTVDALLAAGYALKEAEEGNFSDDRAALLALLFNLDDAYLLASKGNGGLDGWVRFVFGNDGWDVISDYTVNFEDVLKPVNEYARKFEV